MIRLALAEGMTTVLLAERLGISRQLVARYRDEASPCPAGSDRSEAGAGS